ncbi:MAG: ATP-binding protein [Bacteroidota bacterium]
MIALPSHPEDDSATDVKDLNQSINKAEQALHQRSIPAIDDDTEHKWESTSIQLDEYASWLSLPEGVCVFNFRGGDIMISNKRFLELFLFPDRKLDQQHFSILFPREQTDGRITQTELATGIAQAQKTKQSVRLHLSLLKLDGGSFDSEVTIVPCSKNKNAVVLIIKDQSVLKEAERKLMKSEKLYRDFIEYAPVGTIKVGLSGMLEFCSASAEEIFGYGRDEYINQPVLERIHPNDRVHFLSLLKPICENKGAKLEGEFRALKKDGSIIWIRGSGHVKLDENNRPECLLLSFLDITETKDTKDLLNERDAIYHALVVDAHDGIDIIDVTYYNPAKKPTATLLIRNKRMVDILRDNENPFCTAEDLSKIGAAKQTRNRTPEEVFYAAEKNLMTKGYNHDILRVQHADGHKIDIESKEQILNVNDKQILIRYYKDITQRMRQEEQIEEQLLQLNEQNDDLQTYIESNMQLENFAFIASHDLRAPIRNIVSFTNLLERKTANKLEDSEKEFLKYIVESANNMSDLIEDLLTFSRANTNKREVCELRFSTIIKQIEDELGTQIKSRNVKLNWPSEDFVLHVDRIKFYQIFQNLIGNAIKFTPDGRIPLVSIAVTATDEHWTFSIADNGIGISADFYNQVFLIFKRLHSQEEYDGTGIGLAICKRLVEQHNGRIWVESVEGQGATFYFTIAKGLK